MNSKTLILIVDDNQNNVQVLGSLLVREGYKLACASSGKDALEYLSRKRPNLILLDISMPVMNGFEVCKIIKANPIIADIPIIFISALDSTEEKVRAFELGGADYVTKPFQPLELLARVQTHVKISQLNDEVCEQNRELRTQLAFQSCVSQGLKTLLDDGLNHEQILKNICSIVQESFEFNVVSILGCEDKGGQFVSLESLALATSVETKVVNLPLEISDGDIINRLEVAETIVLKNPDHESNILSANIGCMETIVLIPIFLLENSLWGALLVAKESMIFDVDSVKKDLQIIGVSLIQMYLIRRTNEEQLFQSRKMQAVGRLAGGIAHDLNNMLQGVIGYGDMLMTPHISRADINVYVKEILANAESSAKLVKQLLRFAQKDVNILQDVNVNKLFRESLAAIQKKVGSGIEVNLNLSDLEFIISADPAQIRHILLNLTENAAYAIGESGRIDLSIKAIDILDNQYNLFNDLVKGKYVEITFSDNGCGVDPEDQEHVFEPFYTSKEVGEGVGMGLATVFSIVKQHKGEIKLYSEKNVGTTFKIYFPIIEVYESKSIEPDQSFTKEKTILIVEDNESINKLAQLILIDAGYDVLSALSGEEAIDIFNENKDLIDLLLIDVVTPEFSGPEVCQQVSEIKSVSVVFCSGYEKDYLESTYDFEIPGAILKKPYTEKDLLEKVKEALGE
ncbi:MAG: response regulator [Kiritimatiellae bacterium]|jgi:CheY-like chemotaxis protein|nr:response regulator [Kiritimatiellia bacterium]